jgi:hypothetical protein
LDADAILKRDDWPAWFGDGIDYLQNISTAVEWVALLAEFVKLETGLGFTGTVRQYPGHDLSADGSVFIEQTRQQEQA